MQPAGKQETAMSAMKVTAIVMETGNASPPRPLRDLLTTIATTTANNHTAGDAAVGRQGAVGVVNDGDDVGGGSGPGRSNKEETLVLPADSAPALSKEPTRYEVTNNPTLNLNHSAIDLEITTNRGIKLPTWDIKCNFLHAAHLLANGFNRCTFRCPSL